MAVTEQDIIDNASEIAVLINGSDDVTIGDLPSVTEMADSDPLHIQKSGVDSKIEKSDFEVTVGKEVPNGFKNLVIDGDFNHNAMGGTGRGTAGYTIDMWRQGNITSVVSSEIDSDISKNTIAFPSLSAQILNLLQRRKGVNISAGKDMSCFIKISSTSGIDGVDFNYVQNFGAGGSGSVTTTSSSQNISPSTSEEWFRFDITAPSIGGKTIGADNYRQFQILSASDTADITFHSIRVIETPANLPALVIPEWIKQDEDPLVTKLLADPYQRLSNGTAFRWRTTLILADTIDFHIPWYMIQTPTITGVAGTNHFITTLTGAAAVAGFTFNIQGQTDQHVFIRATKVGHGLTDASFVFADGYGLDARY